MNRPAWIIGIGQACALLAFLVGVARRWFPLGVPGEWEWQRLAPAIQVDPLAVGFAALVIGGYATLAAFVARALARGGSVAREVAWVAALGVAAVLVQVVAQEGAPAGYGLAKWILALGNDGASGYHSVARDQMPGGLAAFVREYPRWVEGQDSLHIGTHPPGLFVVARAAYQLTRSNPELSRQVVDHAPGSVRAAIAASRGSQALRRDEAAALILTGASILLLAALTVVPLYALARATAPAAVAWAVASLWPLVPAAILFQPTADTAFPLLSTAALAAAAWAARRGGLAGFALAALAGLILAVGMQFTLAFLAVGLVVAIVLARSPRGWRTGLILIAGTGVSFALATAAWWAGTGANPGSIWWTNQAHHAQFYRDYPRARVAWGVVNPLEAAAALGIPASILALPALGRVRQLPAATWATVAVLIVLTISGRSLSEVARLWLPLFPPILLAAGSTWDRAGGSPGLLGWTIALGGGQALILETLIQVVYPV